MCMVRNFNPYYYGSGDAGKQSFSYIAISIHTTTRVVTSGTGSFNISGVYFNPHHYESGDALLPVDKLSYLDFNPHHYESGDIYLHYKAIVMKSFQSTPLRVW